MKIRVPMFQGKASLAPNQTAVGSIPTGFATPSLPKLTILEVPEESDAFEWMPNFDRWIEEFWN